MKVETRVFDRGKSNERRFLILIPDQVESEQLDFVFGDRVGEDGHIAKVKGSVKTCLIVGEVKLEDGYAGHYMRLERDDNG